MLILKILPKYNDFLVCAVSSQIHQYIPGFDLLLETSDPAFASSGLRTSSIFRLSGLAVLPGEDIMGTIGTLQKELHSKLLKTLADYLVAE